MMDVAPYRVHYRNNICFLCKFFYTKKTLKLLERNCNSSSSHKTNDGSMGQEVNQEAQPNYLFSKDGLVNTRSSKGSLKI